MTKRLMISYDNYSSVGVQENLLSVTKNLSGRELKEFFEAARKSVMGKVAESKTKGKAP